MRLDTERLCPLPSCNRQAWFALGRNKCTWPSGAEQGYVNQPSRKILHLDGPSTAGENRQPHASLVWARGGRIR